MQDEPCEMLEWESRIFGVAVARVRGDTLTRQRAVEIDRWCAAKMVGVLFFSAGSDDPQTTRCAEDGGYQLVEVRMTDLESNPLATLESIYRQLDLPGFEAACAAMQGMILNDAQIDYVTAADCAAKHADALLSRLAQEPKQ